MGSVHIRSHWDRADRLPRSLLHHTRYCQVSYRHHLHPCIYVLDSTIILCPLLHHSHTRHCEVSYRHHFHPCIYVLDIIPRSPQHHTRCFEVSYHLRIRVFMFSLSYLVLYYIIHAIVKYLIISIPIRINMLSSSCQGPFIHFHLLAL